MIENVRSNSRRIAVYDILEYTHYHYNNSALSIRNDIININFVDHFLDSFKIAFMRFD
jgi:hypothetical protein